MSLTERAKAFHERSRANGFYKNAHLKGFMSHQLWEIIKELGEASEAHKKERFANLAEFEQILANKSGSFQYPAEFEYYVKDTFEDEIADAKIRCFDTAGYHGLDLDNATTDKYFKVLVNENEGELYKLSDYIMQINKSIMRYGELWQPVRKERAMLTIIFMIDEIASYYGFDIEKHIELKIKYNETRGVLHGKKY